MPTNHTPYGQLMEERRKKYEAELAERMRVRKLPPDHPDRVEWQQSAKRRCKGASA